MSETMNMSQVSREVASFEPVTVTMSDKTTVDVGRLSWQGFEVIWNGISGIVATVIGDGGDSADVMQAIDSKLQSAPKLVIDLIKGSTNLDDDRLGELTQDYANVIALASNAMDVNFVQYKGVMSFFDVGRRMFAPEKENEKPQKSDEKGTP